MRYLFATVYCIVYFVGAISFFPADNFGSWGTLIFLAPFPTLLVIFPALLIVDKVNDPGYLKVFIVILACHYVISLIGLLYVLASDHKDLTYQMFLRYPKSFVFTAFWYALGQAIICRRAWLTVKNAVN